jgi:transcriptional regulator with XRE-family HTH domain
MPVKPVPQPAKAILIARGETIKEGAEAVGVNAHTFGRVLNGHVAPWPRLRQALADYLGEPVEVLFRDPVSREVA